GSPIQCAETCFIGKCYTEELGCTCTAFLCMKN
uniref:Cyclotide Hyfl-B n=1 Tax=Hybanthus floribundus TaxID=343459 RepID=HYFLB_HYBFL|nr:RecName: Full=Cyclotide Hyfl-B [Hybanthus floribundus]